MSVPIATSPSRSGFGPQLSLAYDSGAGNGPFGLGWNLAIPAITRKTDKGLPKYQDADESDTCILSGAEDLVPVLTETAEGQWVPEEVPLRTVNRITYQIKRYRPRVEGLFARLERWTNQTDPGDIFWRSISKDNITTWYGKTAESRIVDPWDSTRIFSWLICESYDDKGNVLAYTYKAENSDDLDLSHVHERNRTPETRRAQRYLKHIRYGNHTPYFPKLTEPAPWPTLPGEDAWMFEVVFDYGEHDRDNPLPQEEINPWPRRVDPFSSYRPGFDVRTYRLCQRVLMFHHFPEAPDVGANCLVRSTNFDYSTEAPPDDVPNPLYATLRAVTQSGYQRQQGGGYHKQSLPPLEFTYTSPRIGETVRDVEPDSLENLPQGLDGSNYQWVDLDGEGLSGILTEQAGTWLYKRNLSPLNVVEDAHGGHTEARFAALEPVARKPSLAVLGGGRQQLLDLGGNGRLDLVEWQGPMPGFYERTQDEDWDPFTAFRALPTIAWDDPNLRFIDLTGDGHADVLITEQEAFTWYPSMAKEGFHPANRISSMLDEERGPRLIFADGTQSIYLADLSGDGLTDLVRIRNGQVCYWPNLGYGRFGAKVTMDQAPWFDQPDLFDHKRIRLADIDGTGTTDIMYLHRDGVRLYFNQSGNSWSDPQVLNVFPRVDELVSIVATDLLGNGTACLVWSSPLPGDARSPMRYLELMGAQKPYLLIKTRNNLGAESEIQYAPSTKFYVADRLAGKPWITRLPFPVHVVEQVMVTDTWRHTRFATTYSYHHGYFDGIEREFRGFGRVEQIDVESFGRFASHNSESPYITDDQTLYQPPVKTITWFHTGVFFDRRRILSQYQQEYFPNGFAGFPSEAFRENDLPQPDLQGQELTAEEWREALRACKGMMLRQEVYELDVEALEREEHQPVKLFSTAYHNCHIRNLQPRGPNRHAVFLVTESEAITYHYELDLRQEPLRLDPRRAHTLNLNVDEYGNVRQAVSVVYPRIGRHVDETLPDGAENLIAQVQLERHLAYTETRFTNDVNGPANPDQYRLRVPCEVLSYEVTGISPSGPYFTLEELRGRRLSERYQTTGRPVADILYHQIPNRRDPQKRLVEQVRMLFFKDDLTGALPLGQLGSLGLPYETYKLALTDALLNAILRERYTTEVQRALEDESRSGYVSGTDLAGRFPDTDMGQYWVRSGIAGFADDAAEHFYLPERYTDPFNNVTMLTFDPRDLFIAASTDPAGNTTQIVGFDPLDQTAPIIGFDYRVLAPREIRDINDNLSAVLFDVLGLPAAVAVKGKGTQADNLDGFTDPGGVGVTPDLSRLIRLFAEPRPGSESAEEYQRRHRDQARLLLGNATVRHVYHFGEVINADGSVTWGTHPPCAAAILREQHAAALETGQESPLQVAFEYSDGSGTVLVKKVQAEPETAGGPLRWIATGKTILNNKGKPVKQYEPYFSETEHRFDRAETEREVGVTPIMYYDAPGRLIRTELPDGTVSRVEFSPWHVKTFDANDTVLESRWYSERNPVPYDQPLPRDPMTQELTVTPDQRAAWLAAQHATSPAQVHLDSLGREVIAIAHNRVQDTAGAFLHGGTRYRDDKSVTFTKLDAEGKPLWIRDARGNLVMQYITPPKPTRWEDEAHEEIPPESVPCYDIAGNLLFQHSMDAGDRWTINDATGQPFYAWDVNDRVTDGGATILENRISHTTYDVLRRPLTQQLTINAGDWQVVERFVYGGSLTDAAERNLRGQVYQHYDPSGLVTNERVDFKGNLLEVTRRLGSTYSAPVIHWPESPPDESFDAETYTQLTEFDALSRMTRLYNWHHTPERVAVYEPQYNERGVLKREDLFLQAKRETTDGRNRRVGGTRTTAIHAITYNEKSQRTSIQYGNRANRALTSYTYDTDTFRLINLVTTRSNAPTKLQDLHYTYDPVGNITAIKDDAQQTVYFDNTEVQPHCLYEYDGLYRLIKAEGREHAAQNNVQRDYRKFEPIIGIPFPNSPEALQRYVEKYEYDKVGNILSIAHSGGSVLRWKRCYQYALNSNRLLATGAPRELPSPESPCPNHYVETPTLSIRYDYDTHGSMLNLVRTPQEYRLRWDYRDMIHQVNLGGGGQAWYNYDAGKQRTRKRIERNGGTVAERLYLSGMERYRRWRRNPTGDDTPLEEIETHHLFADDQRVLIVEDVLKTDNAELGERTLYRYQLGNHLGSVCVELDEGAEVISYEEYHPYGTTAYSAGRNDVEVQLKRYRYTGMERDEETGLNYHTMRYYVPWLGRWGSSDPIDVQGGVNSYKYVEGNALRYTDPSGLSITVHANTATTSRRTEGIVTDQNTANETFIRDVRAALLESEQAYFTINNQNQLEFLLDTDTSVLMSDAAKELHRFATDDSIDVHVLPTAVRDQLTITTRHSPVQQATLRDLHNNRYARITSINSPELAGGVRPLVRPGEGGTQVQLGSTSQLDDGRIVVAYATFGLSAHSQPRPNDQNRTRRDTNAFRQAQTSETIFHEFNTHAFNLSEDRSAHVDSGNGLDVVRRRIPESSYENTLTRSQGRHGFRNNVDPTNFALSARIERQVYHRITQRFGLNENLGLFRPHYRVTQSFADYQFSD